MKKCAFKYLGMAALLAFAVVVFGQTTAPDRVVGVVTAVDQATNQISVKADTGETRMVVVSTTSALLRMPPGETAAQKAMKISLAEVAVGDRVFARGALIGDGKTLEARQVVVSSTAATAQAQPQQPDPRSRPMAGRIARVDVSKKEITLQPRGREGVTPPTIVVSDATRFFRYAPDSMDINHASRSSLSQMREGDQLRALGERSEDGARFTATEIIAGSMTRTIGEIVSVDAARKELTLKNNEGKTITVAFGDRSSLRRVTPEVAATFATRPGRGDGQPGRPNDGAERGERRERRERPAGENGEARRGGEGRPGRGGRGFQEILAGLPVISLSDLKKGDAVFVSGSEASDASRMTAIMLITGDPAFMQRFLQRGPNRGPQNPGLPGQVIGGGVGPAEPPPNNP
ncbi:MAG TPA: hypothetical protein VJU84_08015 [Pyrinomonadaceae bacterium]|nr:hypothetical protein [Pyrinomonadaceae bacterium]